MTKVPSYRLHKRSGKAVCTINYRDYYLGAHGSRESKAAYKRLISEWEATGRSISFGIAAKTITVAMVAADYLAHCESHYPTGKHNSETNQTRLALEYLEPYLDEMAIEIGPLRLKAIRQSMLDAKNEATGKPLSRQYVNKMVDRIVRMYRWAAENELVPIATHQALRNVRGLQKGRTTAPEAKPVKPVDDAIVEATIEHCTPVVAAMIKTQRLTGMRPGEVCCLTPDMIDRSGAVWVARLPEHKSAWRGKDRSIYLGPKAQDIIRPYLLRAGDAALFSPAEACKQRIERLREQRKTPLSCGNKAGSNRRANPATQPGTQYRTSTYSNAIRYAAAKAFPIDKDATKEERAAHRRKWMWTPNQLRHSAATQIRKLHGIEAARVILGHTSATTTEIYAEQDRESAIQVASKIG